VKKRESGRGQKERLGPDRNEIKAGRSRGITIGPTRKWENQNTSKILSKKEDQLSSGHQISLLRKSQKKEMGAEDARGLKRKGVGH